MNKQPDKMTAYYYRAAHKQTDLYLDNQMHQLLAHAAQSGTDAYLLFADNGYSGLNLDRPAMTQMQMAMAQGLIGKIVVKDISRLARDTAAFLTFAEDAERLLVELETVNGENPGKAVSADEKQHFFSEHTAAKHFEQRASQRDP